MAAFAEETAVTSAPARFKTHSSSSSVSLSSSTTRIFRP